MDLHTHTSRSDFVPTLRFAGQQMMFFMSLFTLVISVPLIAFPLPACVAVKDVIRLPSSDHA